MLRDCLQRSVGAIPSALTYVKALPVFLGSGFSAPLFRSNAKPNGGQPNINWKRSKRLGCGLALVLSAPAVCAAPLTITQLMLPAPIALTPVTDTGAAGLTGTIIQDQILSFQVGQAASGPNTGGIVKGNVQNRVVRKTGSQELIFTWRLRDLEFIDTAPGTGGSEFNFLELITYSFPVAALPADVFVVSPSQSDGTDILDFGEVKFRNGNINATTMDVELNSNVRALDGTTFFGFSTTATAFANTGELDIGNSYFDGAQQLTDSVTVTGMAAPVFGSAPIPPVPLPPAAVGLVFGLAALVAYRRCI